MTTLRCFETWDFIKNRHGVMSS